MDLAAYRASHREGARIEDLFGLIPGGLETALDAGARDGFLSLLLAKRFDAVTALDLRPPRRIQHPSITWVEGDVCSLDFDDNTFDLVLCAEVLEHIPSALLPTACSELARVTRRYLLVGVPYRQDIRLGRTTCCACGHKNPPWGHVNVFDEAIIQKRFSDWLSWDQGSYVGETRSATNALSTLLLDWAGNPYGTYGQEEPCVACGRTLQRPPERTLVQKLATRGAYIINGVQSRFVSPRPNWMHVRLRKRDGGLTPAPGTISALFAQARAVAPGPGRVLTDDRPRSRAQGSTMHSPFRGSRASRSQ